jgi:multidrug efflux pump subunit AcrA (membrane-fusion protein)
MRRCNPGRLDLKRPSSPRRAGADRRGRAWPTPGWCSPGGGRDLQAKLDKTRLVAPVDGVVGILVGEPGEVVPVGKPVLTLEVGNERWFSFTLREDALGRLTVGSTVTLTTDGGRRISARVTELRPLGEFATWRAARAVGDHDLNSFRLRLDPVTAEDKLQPGMTVWLAGNS